MSGAAGGGAGAGAVVRQGHLRKLKTMKKKFFVLRAETADYSAKLEYYESEKKFKAGAAPRRILPLKSCYNITRRLDLKQKHVIALFTREEQFCIVAENEQELHAWLSAILKQHRSDDASGELLHPIQHVWQVNVQKKGLGSSKNIQGLYNLCLTDKALTLVKIKSHNNVISDLGIPERVDYSLKNIRRCGDSECFFYMEVGRQTVTGSGELWMHTDDSNIAQSMHSTIYHAMRNCTKEIENERDHIVLPSGEGGPPARRQTYSDGSGRAGLTNDASTLRNRCDSMPSRACSTFEVERPPPRHNELEGLEISRDEADTVAEWYRTPRIPEEPDCCDISKDFMSTSYRGVSSIHHSRTSSLGVEEGLGLGASVPDGYLPMAPGHDPLGGLVSASSGSVCSGTPSTDPRFSEYQLDPVTSHIGVGECRPPRAYSVGSRPAARPPLEPGRHRAYSVGARHRPRVAPAPAPGASPSPSPCRAEGLRASAEDLMELDFSINSPAAKVFVSHTPPSCSYTESRSKPNVDEYVDMSPRNGGYVEMHPGHPLAPGPSPVAPAATTPDGYVEMNYGRSATRPIAIAAVRPPGPLVPLVPLASSPDDARRRRREPKTPLGSQTLFPLSLDSPASPPELDAEELEEDTPHHLSTVREISEECGRERERERERECRVASCSPQYVALAPPGVTPDPKVDELSCNPTATKTIVRCDAVESRAETSTTATLVLAGGGAPARFSLEDKRSPPAPTTPAPSPCASPSPCGAVPLNYAALDLEPRRVSTASTPRTYTQIDFIRSEKLHAADGT